MLANYSTVLKIITLPLQKEIAWRWEENGNYMTKIWIVYSTHLLRSLSYLTKKDGLMLCTNTQISQVWTQDQFRQTVLEMHIFSVDLYLLETFSCWIYSLVSCLWILKRHKGMNKNQCFLIGVNLNGWIWWRW